MSENIETFNKVIIKGKGLGNQSVAGRRDVQLNPQRQGQIERQESDVEACSTFAVIREKIPLTNDNKHIQAFKQMYNELF